MSLRVVCLMSTYNGEKYIAEQLDSILNQKNVSLEIIIRDDGSTDSTRNILRSYSDNYDNISLIFGSNIGVERSFAELIQQAPDADYYCFSDQDDIWYEDKIYIAIHSLETNKIDSIPILYYCNQDCVDSKGDYLYKRFDNVARQPTFIHTFLNNEYSGCTFAYNFALHSMVKKAYSHFNNDINMLHDVFIMMIAQLIGKTVYDPISHMSFRRHDNNITNSNVYEKSDLYTKNNIIYKKIQTGFSKWRLRGSTSFIARELLNVFYGRIICNDFDSVLYLLDYRKNIKNWFTFVFGSKYSSYYPKPKTIVRIKFFLKFY